MEVTLAYIWVVASIVNKKQGVILNSC